MTSIADRQMLAIAGMRVERRRDDEDDPREWRGWASELERGDEVKGMGVVVSVAAIQTRQARHALIVQYRDPHTGRWRRAIHAWDDQVWLWRDEGW